MLSDFTPMPTLAVKDLAAARAFYEGVLGFAPTGDAPDMALYTSGAGQFLVYPSSFAGTNKATYMAFQVPAAEFDSHVEALRSQGIEFQTFDYPGITWTDGSPTSAASAPSGSLTRTATSSTWRRPPDGQTGRQTHQRGGVVPDHPTPFGVMPVSSRRDRRSASSAPCR